MNNNNESFRPRSMTKTELALLYFPGCRPETARLRLMRWINSCGELLNRLTDTGYCTRQRVLKSRQVRLIVEYLDEP